MAVKNKEKKQIISAVSAALIFGSVTGILTAVIITLYKVCAKHIIALSEHGYHALRGRLYFLPLVACALLLISFLLAYIYKKKKNLRGGGIPTSIGYLRGLVSFKWLENLIGIFALSLSSFLFAVPLGNEGPSVQIGTAIGRGTVYTLTKKRRAWDRYSMTGGACAGFSVATGSPLSGIMFAIEEAHERISPMIIMIASVSVAFSYVTADFLSDIFGVSTRLFPDLHLPSLSLRELWIPLAVGLVFGLFAVLFLKYYRLLNAVLNRKLKKIPHAYKIFTVFALTLAFGLYSYSFVSTGHELMLSLFDGKTAIFALVLLLLVRSTLTLSASNASMTGGLFVPTLTIGALFSALLGRLLMYIPGFAAEDYAVVLVLGLTACIAGMMKMPLTAILFALEALSCYGNIVPCLIVAAVSFIMTELFGVASINENVLDHRIERIHAGKKVTVVDKTVTVKQGSFAIDKQIRDIFWPANFFILSMRRQKLYDADMDEHSRRELQEGDLLHIRYSTYNQEKTEEELAALIGRQDSSVSLKSTNDGRHTHEADRAF